MRHKGPKQGVTWVDLWHAATAVDWRLAQAGDDKARSLLLATDDLVELHLRRLASHVHYSRTGDADAAQHMLAVSAPGSSTDVAPQWLVSESSTYSKSEFQRMERVKGATRLRGPGRGRGGDEEGKGEGRGRGRGRGRSDTQG